VSFIDEHRDRFGGVEPICTTLTGHGCGIDPSTYHHFKSVRHLLAPCAIASSRS
jgi:putative transposase